jgi:hypothetical protein
MTSGPSRQGTLPLGEWTSSAEDSPARTSASPGGGRASTGHGRACGPSSPESFASYDPASRSWRTSQGCLFGGWIGFSGTWPSWGTMRNGACCRLPPLVPSTFGRGSLLWPTPNAEGGTGYMSGSKRDVWRPTLELAVRMAPDGLPPLIRKGLDSDVARLYPTPTSCHRNLAGGSNSRASAIRRGIYIAGALNPRFVEWLMGFPIGWCSFEPSATPSSPPSPNGSGAAS